METSQEERGREYLESLKKQIAAMEPIERACSMAVVNLGTVIATLITNERWEAIDEMMDVCNELFEQATRIKNEEKNQTVH